MMNLYPFMMMPIFNLPNEKFFRPPLLCDLLNSLVNYTKPDDEKVKLSQIPNAAAPLVFDFTYPLSNKVNKNDFETMILKKFYMRRIGYETYTAWKMQLDVKMNEIMPVYNKLFDALDNWNLFLDGESFRRTINNEHESSTETSSERVDTTSDETRNTTSTTTSTTDSTNSIRKFSKLPQNEISDIENNNYMTDYTHDTNSGTSSGTGSGTNNTTNTGRNTGNESGTNDFNESSNTIETYTKDVSNKIEIYNKFLENRNHIMTLIFKDLDSLFYGISNFN